MKKLIYSSIFVLLLGFVTNLSAQDKNDNKSNKKVKDNTSRVNLIGYKWLYVNEGGVVYSGEGDDKKALYVYFPANKPDTFTSFAGCNDVSGNVSAGERGQLTFINSFVTQRVCNTSSYDQNFLDMTQKANKYKITDDKLSVYSDHELLMTFRKQTDKEKKEEQKKLSKKDSNKNKK